MKDYRKDFPLLRDTDYIYFDSAATSQRPQQVLDAVSSFYTEANANPMRGLYDWSKEATKRYEDAREKTASFIGAESAESIIFTRNTTEAINLVAYSYGLSNVKEGDEIVLSVAEHHSNILPWQMVAKKTGAKLVYLETNEDGKITKDEYEGKISDRCAILAIGHVSNVLGTKAPVKEMASYAHGKGAAVIVDGAQAVPHMAVDVRDIDADFYAFSGHKMLAPFGIGALYGKLDLLSEMPPFLSGGEMIEYVQKESATFAPLPHKFEAGTVNAAGASGLAAAIDYIRDVGFDHIREREDILTKRLMEGMKELSYITVYGAADPLDHNGIVTFNVEGVHPHDLSDLLNEDRICVRAGHHCAQVLMKHLGTGSTARASLYFYNTEDEVDRFLDSLTKVRSVMGY